MYTWKKLTHCEYAHYTSNTLWRFKTVWIRLLYHRARKVYSKSILFKNQIWLNDKLIAWNSYPKYINKLILNHIESYLNKAKQIMKQKWRKYRWVYFIKCTIKIFKRNFKKKVAIITRFNNAKVSMFCSNRNKIKFDPKSNVKVHWSWLSTTVYWQIWLLYNYMFKWTCYTCKKTFTSNLTSCSEFIYLVEIFKNSDLM